MARSLHLFILAGVIAFLLGLHYFDYTPSLSFPFGPVVDDEESFHNRLSTVRPLDSAQHSRTLGVFTDIYVISLERREDRRKEMDKLKRALRVDWTYLFAVDMDSEQVSLLESHLRDVRAKHQKADFAWPEPPPADPESYVAGGADLWPSEPAPEVPPDAPQIDAMAWEFDLPEPGKGLPMNRPRIATWASHIHAIRLIADDPRPEAAGLILEDDVDMEWDIERRVRGMWPALPSDWDMVMLGYCWTPETQNTALVNAPNLHPSYLPLCTHAYAVSRNGARRMLYYLRYELYAYSRPIDNAFQFLIMRKLIKSFSVSPSIVVQRKDGYSDIWKGKEFGRVDWLADSTVDRIRLLEEALNATASVITTSS